MSVRKAQVWFDNAAGALTDFSSDINNCQPNIAREVLEDTGLNDTYQQNAAIGLISGSIAMSGWYRAGAGAATGIVKSLLGAATTSLSKTWQMKVGGHYLNAEVIADGVSIGPADGHGIITWACNLLTDGTVNSTSVALS